MSKDKKEPALLESPLTLRNADVHQACFTIDEAANSPLRSNPVMGFDRSVLPADYEPATHDVTGSIVVKVTVTRKPVCKNPKCKHLLNEAGTCPKGCDQKEKY